MKTNPSKKADTTSTKIQSKVDKSGTDPNRYGGYYSQQEAERLGSIKRNRKQESLIPGVDANISMLERILMVAAGSYLMYYSLWGKKKHVAGSIAAGGMLARGISGYCPVYDVTNNDGGFLKGTDVNIRTAVTIDKPVHEVYDFWRKLENLPKFMNHLESVNEIDSVTSTWKANGPAGIGSISWKAQILMDEKNKMLSWHSLPESTIDNAGKVYFKNVNGKTELDVTISYHAPLGIAGEAAAKLLNPLFEKMVKNDIDNLKNYLESDRHIFKNNMN